MSKYGDAFREGESHPPHVLSVVVMILSVAIIVLFCLSWVRSCSEREDFISSCLAVGGVAVRAGDAQTCKGQP